MSAAFQPQIILLREGTDTSQGKAQIISNINACEAVAEVVASTLGPRGMDKLVHDGQRTTISNDGATIMRLLDIAHPAAKTLVDISMAQVRADLHKSFCSRNNNTYYCDRTLKLVMVQHL
jgi:T-complex protein 1 subunit eta